MSHCGCALMAKKCSKKCEALQICCLLVKAIALIL